MVKLECGDKGDSIKPDVKKDLAVQLVLSLILGASAAIAFCVRVPAMAAPKRQKC
jgi:hypothetical protein